MVITKTRPPWATDEKLKHLILMPALSQLTIWAIEEYL